MPQFDGFIGLMDSRSFGSVWYWLIVIGLWSVMGRTILGVPVEVVLGARRAQSSGDTDGDAVITLLDWLSLLLPRWQLGTREGSVMLGGMLFLLTSLAVLGFGYDLEMAQALSLLLIPVVILFWMRVRLARRLVPLIHSGQAGERPLSEIASDVIRYMIWHRRFFVMLSILAVAATALWGMYWSLMHPNGL